MKQLDIGHVLLSLYQAALAPDQWTNALRQVSDFVGGCAAAMEFVQLPSTHIQIAAEYGYDAQELLSIVGTELVEMDPWWVCVHMEPDSNFHIGSKYVSAKKFRASMFYNEGLRRVDSDWRDVMALVAPLSDGNTGLFTVYRGGDDDDFGYSEMERMRTLRPHIMQALEISSRLGGLQLHEALSGQLRSERGDAVLFLDRRGAVVFANPLADTFLAEGNGPLVLRDGRLQIRGSQANKALQEAITQCLNPMGLQPSRSGNTVVWRHGGTRYSACLTPCLDHALPTVPSLGYRVPEVAVIVRHFKPDSIGIASRVQQAFALTDAEKRVLERFLQGLSMQQICESSSVTMNTLKSQCRAIYQKTGTANQAGLIRMSLAAFSA